MSLESNRKRSDTPPKEAYLDRVVRLALTAGQRRIELDKAYVEINRLVSLCVAHGIDPTTDDE